MKIPYKTGVVVALLLLASGLLLYWRSGVVLSDFGTCLIIFICAPTLLLLLAVLELHERVQALGNHKQDGG